MPTSSSKNAFALASLSSIVVLRSLALNQKHPRQQQRRADDPSGIKAHLRHVEPAEVVHHDGRRQLAHEGDGDYGGGVRPRESENRRDYREDATEPADPRPPRRLR